MPQPGLTALVENRRKARKVRWLFWGSLFWAAGWLAWAGDSAQSFGLSPGDGGVLRPPGERWGVAAILATLGLLPGLGLAVYMRRYIVRLVREGDTAHVTVLGVWKARERSRPLSAFEGGDAHAGRMSAGGVSVNAPWITLRIDGRRYVVDLQAERVDRKGLARLARDGRRAAAQARRP